MAFIDGENGENFMTEIFRLTRFSRSDTLKQVKDLNKLIMNYEQKYKDALERARQFSEHPLQEDSATIVEYIFPELKESEDKQNRKWILEYLYDGLRKSDEQFKGEFKTAIAWLEKQGQEPKKVSIWKHWKNGIAGNGSGEQKYLIRTGNTYYLSSCLGFECDYIELSELDNLMLEKQGEQKPTDNKERLDLLKFIRKETGCGLADANNALLKLIKVLKQHPLLIMDKPHKLKIEWEKQQEKND